MLRLKLLWEGVIGQHGDAGVYDKGRLLLQLSCCNVLCIMNTFIKQIFALAHHVQRFIGSTISHWFLHSFGLKTAQNCKLITTWLSATRSNVQYLEIVTNKVRAYIIPVRRFATKSAVMKFVKP